MVLTREKIGIITVVVVAVLFIANRFFKETKFSHLLNTVLGFAIPIVIGVGAWFYFTHAVSPPMQAGSTDRYRQWEQELIRNFSGWRGVESVTIDGTLVSISFSSTVTEDVAKELAHKAAEGVAELRRDQGNSNDFKVVILVDKERVHLLTYNPYKGVIKEEHF